MQIPNETYQLIDLQLGCPSPSLFPRRDLLASMQYVLSNEDVASTALIYGNNPGYNPLRESIACWLTDFYKPTTGPILPSQICISNGASGNLASILAKFTDPCFTRAKWMIEPTYFLACPTFEDAGFTGRLRGIPEDDEGIDINFLRSRLQEMNDKVIASTVLKTGQRYPKLYRHVFYCVPTFSNPSSKTMSLRRRESLVRLAREFDALIIADDVYDFLRWPSSPTVFGCEYTANLAHSKSSASSCVPVFSGQSSTPPRLVDIDRTLTGNPGLPYGNTVSNGTFSKLIAPGIRVGWCEGRNDAFAAELSAVGSTWSGGAPSHMASVFVDTLLRTGSLERHIREVLIPTYARRRAAMMQAVQHRLISMGVKIKTGASYSTMAALDPSDEHLLDVVEDAATEQVGGFFTYLTFPAHFPSVTEIARAALQDYNTIIAPGELMVVAGDPGSSERGALAFRHGARLSWSWCTETEIEEGIRRLESVIRGLLGERCKVNGT